MNLHRLLLELDATGNPVRVALIGAGKFGTMYLSQAGRTPGIHIAALVDLDPARAQAARARAGRPRPAPCGGPWPPRRSASGTSHASVSPAFFVLARCRLPSTSFCNCSHLNP